VVRAFRTFIGVDLGGGKGKNTAVARLTLSPEGTAVRVEEVSAKVGRNGTSSPFYDRQLLEYLARWKDQAVVAIDAPLTMTACMRCREPVCPGLEGCVDPTVVWFRTIGDSLLAEGGLRNGKPLSTPYTQRATEVWLHKKVGVLPRETLGQGMGPLTARARHLVRALEPHYQLDHNLIEVYPKATLQLLFSAQVARSYKRGAPAYEIRQRILHTFADLEFGPRTGMQREQCFANDHCFDALLCAYTAFLWARDGWQRPLEHGEIWSSDGWIWHPPGGEPRSRPSD
jgi:predicted nuclease with RNAse H fold